MQEQFIDHAAKGPASPYNTTPINFSGARSFFGIGTQLRFTPLGPTPEFVVYNTYILKLPKK